MATLPKIIAFYLPQFHPVPENDEWWGPGFTEWTNVSAAIPLYPGHYQPQLPADLGFYDLRAQEVRTQQAALASEYGVYGFCYYYYWFSGRKILERPVYEMLNSGEPNFPFCLCWANENWTRRWDGAEDELLLQQKYTTEDPVQFIRELAPFFEDSRYIRVDGKPLLIVYRPSVIPTAMPVVRTWRKEAQRLGLGEMYIGGALTFGEQDPRQLGFDCAVEFPPHGIVADELSAREFGISPKFTGKIYDYAQVVTNEIRKPAYSFKTYRTAMPSWDNSARTGLRAHIFSNADPTGFGMWVDHLISEAKANGSEFVFVNAWNEWAEGAHLEPDRRFGHQWLQAIKNALSGTSTAQVCIEILSAHLVAAPASVREKLAQLKDAIFNHERSAKVAAQTFQATVSFAEKFMPIHFSGDLPTGIAGMTFLVNAQNFFDNIAIGNGAETVMGPGESSYITGWIFAPGVTAHLNSPVILMLQHQVSKRNYYAITDNRVEREDVSHHYSHINNEAETRFCGFELSMSTRGVPPGRYSLIIGVPAESTLALGAISANVLVEG